jgi:hypothetical protein
VSIPEFHVSLNFLEIVRKTGVIFKPLLYCFYEHSNSSKISVGIATDYGVGGPGIKSRWGRDFQPVQTGPGAHPASCEMGTGSFPGVKCGRGVLLTTHPPLVL